MTRQGKIRAALDSLSSEERVKLMTKLYRGPAAARGTATRRLSANAQAFVSAANRLRRTLSEAETELKRSAPTTKAGRAVLAKALELKRCLDGLDPDVARAVAEAEMAMAEAQDSAAKVERGISQAGRGRVH